MGFAERNNKKAEHGGKSLMLVCDVMCCYVTNWHSNWLKREANQFKTLKLSVLLVKMPRGIKRNFVGEAAPAVGGKNKDLSKGAKSTGQNEAVAMLTVNSKQKSDNEIPKSNHRRASKRLIKAKRKLDFVYEQDKSSSELVSNAGLGENNNAQIRVQNFGRHVRQEGRKDRMNVNTKVKGKMKQSTIINNKTAGKLTKDVFDGIQVSVNSDEELDYEDDLPDPDEDGSVFHQSDKEETDDTDGLAVAESTNNGLGLGASSASMTEEETIMNNPHLRKLLNKMLDERIKDANIRGESSGSQLLTRMTPQAEQSSKGPKRNNTGNSLPRNNNLGNALVKSPSDTMIYVPALKRVVNQKEVFGVGTLNVRGNGRSPQNIELLTSNEGSEWGVFVNHDKEL